MLLLCGSPEVDNTYLGDLYLQRQGALFPAHVARTLVVGEVLWDQFPNSVRLGGAALNFAVHLCRLGHAPLLVSAVGTDALGEKARQAIASLGLDTSLVQSTDRFQTGRAVVHIGPGDDTSFTIERPAAYDAVTLADVSIQQIAQWNPTWFYYGTLFPSSGHARSVLNRLLNAVPGAARFYDLNLRPGFEDPELVQELLIAADVVKLNERELRFAHEHFDLPSDPENFCRAGAEQYRWRAACITLGARGCAMFLDGEYVEEPGVRVNVEDPVGAGDAFSAAFLHGIVSTWPVARVARFANCVAARVVAMHGAIPDWAPQGRQP